MTTDSPVTRLRELHTFAPGSGRCHEDGEDYPCLTIAALDALEADISAMADGPSVKWWQLALNLLHTRIDAATVLANRVLSDFGECDDPEDCTGCSLCRAKAWLAGDKEEHGEL